MWLDLSRHTPLSLQICFEGPTFVWHLVDCLPLLHDFLLPCSFVAQRLLSLMPDMQAYAPRALIHVRALMTLLPQSLPGRPRTDGFMKICRLGLNSVCASY